MISGCSLTLILKNVGSSFRVARLVLGKAGIVSLGNQCKNNPWFSHIPTDNATEYFLESYVGETKGCSYFSFFLNSLLD